MMCLRLQGPRAVTRSRSFRAPARLGIIVGSASPPSGEKYVNIHNRLTGSGMTKELADVVVSDFVPVFTVLDLFQAVMERFDKLEERFDTSEGRIEKKIETFEGRIEKKFETFEERIEKMLDDKFTVFFHKFVIVMLLATLASSTSDFWVPSVMSTMLRLLTKT